MEAAVQISGFGILAPVSGSGGAVPGFRARNHIPDRKSLKLMTRSVKLGVAAVRMALEATPGWQDVSPDRRGLFIGASPQPGDSADLRPALERAIVDGRFDLPTFAAEGYPLIYPLWLLRGLSNNVLGFSSAAFDLQGVNANYCDGERGGWNALLEGARAVSEGRADLCVAGGADSLLDAQGLFGDRFCGEGAAFVVFTRSESSMHFSQDALDRAEAEIGYLGAATWPVALARSLHP